MVSAKAVGAPACASPLEFVAVTLMVAAPGLVGVPLSTHEPDRFKPAGTPVAVQVIGVSPAEKENVWLYADATVAAGSGLVIENTGKVSVVSAKA